MEVPRHTIRDIEVIPSSSTNIRHIKVDYCRYESYKKREAPVGSSHEVDIGVIPPRASLPTPNSRH